MTAPMRQGTTDPAAQLAGVLAGLANQIRGGRYPWWYPDNAKQNALDYNVYATDFLPLPASSTVQNSINISGTAAFVILSAVIVETATNNTTLLPFQPLLFRLRDTGSNRDLSNVPIHASNWFGTAGLPKYWDVPKIITPNSTFVVEAQNLEAIDRNVRVAFHGFNIYNFKP